MSPDINRALVIRNTRVIIVLCVVSVLIVMGLITETSSLLNQLVGKCKYFIFILLKKSFALSNVIFMWLYLRSRLMNVLFSFMNNLAVKHLSGTKTSRNQLSAIPERVSANNWIHNTLLFLLKLKFNPIIVLSIAGKILIRIFFKLCLVFRTFLITFVKLKNKKKLILQSKTQ